MLKISRKFAPMSVERKIKRLNYFVLGILLLCLNASATDYILNTPGSTTTNGNGTTYNQANPAAQTPDISNGLATGDTLTLTGASGGGSGEYSIDISNFATAIIGATGIGNNTITLESGSKINAESYSNGIKVFGSTTSSSITGLVGGTPDNTVIINSGALIDIKPLTGSGTSIIGNNNNRITVYGTINNYLENGAGISVENNNEITLEGSVNNSFTDNLGPRSGITINTRNILNINGTINSTGDNTGSSEAINAKISNDITINGYVNSSSAFACKLGSANNLLLDGRISIDNNNTGILGSAKNRVILTKNSEITTDQPNTYGIEFISDLSYNGNVAYISGHIKAQHALISGCGTEGGTPIGTSNAFYLLNGANIEGNIENFDFENNSTSYLLFGYAVNSSTGMANRNSTDQTFDFTLNNNISDPSMTPSTGYWDLFLAGGKTTLNGSVNQTSRLLIGADCFDGTTITDGHDADGNPETANLTKITGATAILTVNNSIATLNAINGPSGSQTTNTASVIVGSGSTYNLNGTHTHEFGNPDSFNILGTLNLGTNAQITDYQGNDDVVLTLGGKSQNNTGAIVNGTLNSYAASLALGINTYPGSTGNININAGTLTLNSYAASLALGINTYSGSTGNININAGTLTLNSLTNNGKINFYIGKTASLINNTSNAIDLSGNKGALTLDFGNSADTSVHARTSGQFKSAATYEISSIYGINGVSGITYANVFDTDIIDENNQSYANNTELNNDFDRHRIYTLTNNGHDVFVKNSNYIRGEILALGGTEQEADAADYLVENERFFDTTGQTFINQLTALPENHLLRGAQELIGEEATAGIIQSGLQSVTAAIGAVNNQLTSFRMGNLAAGMASSFSAAGSTAATNNIPDAEELTNAYNATTTGSTNNNTAYHKLTVWANSFGGFGEQSTIGDTIGYDFWNAGMMLGMDYAFAEELRIGGLLGYSYNQTDLYTNRGDSTDNSLRLGAYSSYNWDNFFVDLSPTLGIHFIDSNRNLITNGLTAKGEHTALDFNIQGTIGYTFNLPADVLFTPSYSLGYTFFHDPDYTETGAKAGNLAFSSFDSNSLLQDIGIKFGKLFRVDSSLTFLPEVWSGWEVEYLNTGGNRSATTSTSIGGNTYSTAMTGLETYRGYWGIGLTALIKDNISVFGRYDHKIWSNGFNAGFSAGIKIKF